MATLMDDDLLAQYRQGDNAAGETLLRRHHKLILWHAHASFRRRPLGAPLELDDLVQIASIGFLKAARKWDKLRGASFAGFAGNVIRGALVDGFRKVDFLTKSEREQGATARLVQAAWDADSAVDRSHPVAVLDRRPDDDDDWWNDQLRGLTEISRRVLTLYFRHEMTLTEAGKVVNLSQSQCSTIVRQALKALRNRDQGLSAAMRPGEASEGAPGDRQPPTAGAENGRKSTSQPPKSFRGNSRFSF